MRCFLLCIGCLLAAAPVRCAEEPAAAKPPEADAPWHVPIPAAGPEVAFVWNDFTRYKPDKHLFVMQDLWLPATFAAAGYRPRILLSPAMAADPRVRRALKMCDYEALAVTLDEQTDLKRFALVVGPSSTFWPPPSGLVPALERYVREGGRYIHPGLSLEPEAEWFRFLGIESNARAESVPLAVAPGDQHPLSAGLDGPLRPARDQTTMALGKPLPRGSVPLTHANSQVPFLRVWDEGQGKVVHINTEFYASRRHALGREGLMLADLVLRAADWLIGSPPRRPWSTTRQRVALLKETDQLKPAGKDALLFSTSFDDKADLDAWTLWDTKSPATTDRKSDWWIDTNMGALVESSNIYSGVGVGTRAVIGRPEWANYVISATLACHDDDEFGIIFRYQDEGNYYRLFLDADTIAQVRLQKRRNGQLETLDGVSQPYLPGVPVRYQIAMRDDNLVVATNGKPILMVNDPDFRSGRAGVETSGSDWVVTYDFEVFALDGAPARTGQAVPQTPEGGAPAAAPPAAGGT